MDKIANTPLEAFHTLPPEQVLEAIMSLPVEQRLGILTDFLSGYKEKS